MVISRNVAMSVVVLWRCRPQHPFEEPRWTWWKRNKTLPFPGIKPRLSPLLGNHFNKHPDSLLAVLVIVKQLPYP
jgi:hypothetical protein